MIDAKQTTRNGKPTWEIDIPASILGKRKRVFGKTRTIAETRAKHAIDGKRALGDLAVTAAEAQLVLKFKDRGWTLAEMDECLTRGEAFRGKILLAEEAAEKYLTDPREEKFGKRHLENLRSRLRQFADAFAGRQLASVTGGEISNYVRGWGQSAPNHFRVVRALFNHAFVQDWVPANPMLKVPPPVVTPTEKKALTPEQFGRALRIAAGLDPGLGAHKPRGGAQMPPPTRYEPMLRFLVITGTCGLRTSEAMAFRCERLNRRSFEVHVDKMKTRKTGMSERFFIPPEMAIAWLRYLDLPVSGPLVDSPDMTFRRARAKLVRALGLKQWPHNILRRSAASYMLKILGGEKTAPILGHTDAKTTFAKYRVCRDEETALQWFALTPDLVFDDEKWQQFLDSQKNPSSAKADK